jgi:hypothetical protein
MHCLHDNDGDSVDRQHPQQQQQQQQRARGDSVFDSFAGSGFDVDVVADVTGVSPPDYEAAKC